MWPRVKTKGPFHDWCCKPQWFVASIGLQQASFIGLQEVTSKVSSHSLRQCDPWKWFVAATIPLLLSAHVFLRPWSGQVSERGMGDWTLTRNNETGVGNEITGIEGLVEQIGGWTCTYTSADTEILARTGGIDVTAVWFYLNTHFFLHRVHGNTKHLPRLQGFTGNRRIVPHNQLLMEI